eukprot:4923524-Heterocapsa_arctica.AAC.1
MPIIWRSPCCSGRCSLWDSSTTSSQGHSFSAWALTLCESARICIGTPESTWIVGRALHLAQIKPCVRRWSPT